ncbi:DEAD/DEAH box helicase [Helicobacter cetorum]|uniref:DEAD/DEAH box helicase n=1 Tax=Helicobacter cetorum TaxID=138563 RepID=UPI001F1AC78D|nr:DEAD/DEAH box helicase [Helicobacter cetorum]
MTHNTNTTKHAQDYSKETELFDELPTELDDDNNNNKKPSFNDLGLKAQVLKSIQEAGFTSPSPIQEKAIPAVLQGRDVIAQAQTGTGKTAAFALPIINNLKNNHTIEALIITPTRELAMQISDEIFKLGKHTKTKTVCVYGGQSIKRQCEFIEKNPQVMIATPGRLLDHLKNERISRFVPRVVVLDESDEMLDMGFLDDIEEIFDYLPSEAQILLFSATMPEPIKKLADKILENPIKIHIAPSNITNTDISQRFYVINEHERAEAIMRLLDTQSLAKSIIFTRTKKEANELNQILNAKNYKCTALHGDMEQRERRASIMAFKKNEVDVLVATDVASRGLDISDVSHVFNYHLPLNTESYIHRIGRTGRAGKKGVAITLVTPLEYKELLRMQKDIGSKIELFEIPSMDENQIVKTLQNAKVSEGIVSLYEQLKEEFEPSQLILKLLSLQFETNKIGLNQQELHAIQNPKESRERKENKQHNKHRSKGHSPKRGYSKDKHHKKSSRNHSKNHRRP